MHGVESEWLETVPVREVFRRQVVWDGAVEAFKLIGHAEAERAYAWSHAPEGNKRRFVAVLGVPPRRRVLLREIASRMI